MHKHSKITDLLGHLMGSCGKPGGDPQPDVYHESAGYSYAADKIMDSITY